MLPMKLPLRPQWQLHDPASIEFANRGALKHFRTLLAAQEQLETRYLNTVYMSTLMFRYIEGRVKLRWRLSSQS